MNTKKALLCSMLVLLTGIIWANTLSMFVEAHRYLDRNLNNMVLLDYQIPYRSLTFLAQHGGFFAEVSISVNISNADSVVFSQEYVDNVGIRNRIDAGSTRKSYLNRLSYALPGGDLRLIFSVADRNSNHTFSRTIELPALPQNALLSDLELSSQVQADSTQYLNQFRRKGVLYKSEPSGLFNVAETDFLHLYFEVYSNPEDREETAFLTVDVEKGDSLVIDMFNDLNLASNIEGITLRIPLRDLPAGAYNGVVALVLGEREELRRFQFAVQEEVDTYIFLMPDPEEEVRLIRYFIGNRVPSDWAGMSLPAKRNFISSFWAEQAGRMQTTVSDAIEQIRQRVEYCNARYSHFQQGWTTDPGRIYIRNGAPDEIENGESSDETRFVRKDYQIWKYRSRPNAVYLFVDMQMSGNFRLLYVNNDPMESSNPAWQDYLGEDFDLSKLSN